MSGGEDLAPAVAAVQRAAITAGDVSGNCDSAIALIRHGDVFGAAMRMEWAEENVLSAVHRIAEARAAIAAATRGAQ